MSGQKAAKQKWEERALYRMGYIGQRDMYQRRLANKITDLSEEDIELAVGCTD